jgi:hypothetical protein
VSLAEHPRSRALRWTNILTSVELFAGAGVVGLLATGVAAAVLGLALFAAGHALATLMSDAAHLLPRGRPLESAERRGLLVALGACVPAIAFALCAVAPMGGRTYDLWLSGVISAGVFSFFVARAQTRVRGGSGESAGLEGLSSKSRE